MNIKILPQTKSWLAPIIGGALGLTYGLVNYFLDLEAMNAPRLFSWLLEVVTILIPLMFGILIGISFNHARRQIRMNQILSTQNAKLQRNLLTYTLSSHILHEMRNPLHNLAAVVEKWRGQFSTEEAAIVDRNLSRLRLVTNQLSRWNALEDGIDLKERTSLPFWFHEFLADKVRPQFHENRIRFEERLEPVAVFMHPLMLEQCFIPLFNNAIEAVRQSETDRSIRLSIAKDSSRAGWVKVEIVNSGGGYPAEVLETQAQEPVKSQSGLGLGLVLIRRALEQVDGSLVLSNDHGHAVTSVWIPGESE